MLLFVGFLILTFVGSGVCGNSHRPRRDSEPSCPRNEHYTRNNPRCIRTCANRGVAISDDCKPFCGCVCNGGLVRLNDDGSGKCVPESKCPPICCPKHSHYVIEDNQCQKTCGNRLMTNSDVAGACVPFTGCSCRPGYVRLYDDATGPCIPEKKCPPIPTQCGVNEEATSCRISCPPQTCDSIFTLYNCVPTECEPGCDCKNGYLRNDDGICILSEDCFEPDPIECAENEVASDCAIQCPPQSCESLFKIYLCVDKLNCTAGCNCIDGHLRNSLGKCVPSEECYNDPAGCKGDVNATRARGCNSLNPPTCENPNPKRSSRICKLNSCECKPGYIKSCKHGNCIESNDCPGGSPNCGANQTYVGCKFGCPTNYCPVDDSRALVACSLPFPCQGGCACESGYLIVSRDNPQCVLASDCPDIKCTRPNEVLDRNPSSCFFERCEDRGSECNSPYPPGPRCVCEDGYFRNESDICVPVSECPPLECKDDLNATYTECTSYCPPSCDDIGQEPKSCIASCAPAGCACNPGYVLNYDGKCIDPKDCPGCKDPNAVYNGCPSACEPTCTKPNRNQRCTRQCLPSGCVCKPEFVLNEKTGKCVKPNSCPVEKGCGGDLNATHADCPSSCPPTCANRYSKEKTVCPAVCDPSGCVCKQGYILTKKGGQCVKTEDCPVKDCRGDPNAVYKECTSACEPTCTNPDPQICTLQCLPPSCVCKPDFVLNEETGKCVKLESCPVIGCGGDPNAVFTNCTSACEPSCSNPNPQVCTLQCLPPSCVCKPDFVLNEETGKCVKLESCPVVGCGGDPNAVYKECTSACEPTCTNPDPQVCTLQCLPPSCVCKPDFVLNENTGKCVKLESCPGCKGDPNAVFSECPSACEPNCTNLKPQICTKQCMPPGCVCKSGHVLNEKTGKCVKPETCPEKACEGDPNAMYSECPSACEPTCTKSDPNQLCTTQCLSPGCVCKPGFVRNEKTKKCVKPETCPAEPQCNGDRNATYTENPENCQPTCKNPDPEGDCMDMSTPPACICKQGYIFKKKGGRCIKPEDCSGGSPKCRANETYVYCNAGCPTDYCPTDDSLSIIACDPPYPCLGGCSCKGGYLMASEDDDRCILSSECPQINCSRPNEFWDAYAPGCLQERCDDRDIPCDFQYPGPPRCRCIAGYYRNRDDICVPESECPEPGCKGDLNATFSECPSECPATCGDSPGQGCTTVCAKPGCVCHDGFVLSKPGGVCIRSKDCDPSTPVCGINEIAKDCRRICPPQTCLSKYALFRCVADIPCEPGCDCIPNYLRNNKGICILSEKCPPLEPEPTCGYNEVSVACRQICPPQNCEIAYTEYACTNESKICEPGCDCLPDHLRNGSGICIPNDQCPYPSTPVCGINEIARDCKKICPPQSCKSKYIKYNCIQDIPCEPGCDCVNNYLRNDTGICIPSEKCPPLEPEPTCGYNEVSVPCRQICPPQNCDISYTDYACTNESEICEPGCDCLPDHLRNGSGICIPNDQCAGPCQIPEECQRTCASPNPLNCGYDPPKENTNGCDCKEGYILSEKGGDCIPIENCPPEIACHGDPNAVPKRCPKPCPSTCDSPDQTPCKRACYPIACECKPGYLLSNESGLCILPDKCPGGNPCGKNGRFVDCKTECPDDYCPVDDSRALVFCDPPAGCLSGCICNLNNKRKSRKHPKCITSSKCRPVNCTRPNEEWSSCPSACLAEDCEDVNNQPTACNTLVLNCQPRCVCKKNHFRNSNGTCIPAKDCPKGCEGDLNAVFSECPSACELTCKKPQVDVCTDQCLAPGCVCKSGFVLNEVDGKCTELENCPAPECEDVNAMYKSCPSACEPTCARPGPYQVCTDECKPARCVCKEGFVLNEKDGKCVKPTHCPAP